MTPACGFPLLGRSCVLTRRHGSPHHAIEQPEALTVSVDRRITVVVMCDWHAADRWGVADALWDIWDPLGADPPARD